MTSIQFSDFEDKEKALETLSKYSETVLKSFTVDMLRIVSKPIISNNRKLKKQDLIDKILECVKQYKEVNKNVLNKELGNCVNKDDMITIIKNGFLKNIKPDILANKVFSNWELQVLAGDIKTITVCKDRMNNVNFAIKFLINEDPTIENYCKEFKHNLYYNTDIKNWDKQNNKDYANSIDTIKTIEDKILLNGDDILQWCLEVLTETAKSDIKLSRNWYIVSLALELTSGRRMEEIHGQTIHYPLVSRYFKKSENDYIFISQLAKSIPDKSFIFKPLVNADLWLNCFNKLPETCKLLTEDKVNQVISSNCRKNKNFNNALKLLGLKQYKDARDFYIAYRLTTEYKKGLTNYNNESDYVQSIIGHDSKKSGHSYEKFVIV